MIIELSRDSKFLEIRFDDDVISPTLVERDEHGYITKVEFEDAGGVKGATKRKITFEISPESKVLETRLHDEVKYVAPFFAPRVDVGITCSATACMCASECNAQSKYRQV